MEYVYTGTDERHYLSHVNAYTGRTLEAVPGGVYSIKVASGQSAGLSVPPSDGRWVPVREQAPSAPPAPPGRFSAPTSPVPPADPPAVNDPAAAPAADKEE